MESQISKMSDKIKQSQLSLNLKLKIETNTIYDLLFIYHLLDMFMIYLCIFLILYINETYFITYLKFILKGFNICYSKYNNKHHKVLCSIKNDMTFVHFHYNVFGALCYIIIFRCIIFTGLKLAQY